MSNPSNNIRLLFLQIAGALAFVSCNLPSSTPQGRLAGNKAGGQQTTVDTQAVRVDALAIAFNQNLIDQGLSEGQAVVVSNSARSEMSAVASGAIIISDTTSMALQAEPPTIGELMGALARGATKSLAVPEVLATASAEKIEIGRIITRAALSTIAANSESSASEENRSSSLKEIVAEITGRLSDAGIPADDIPDATAAISGEAAANFVRAGFVTSDAEVVLPKIAQSAAKGVAGAGYTSDRVPVVLEEATKAMVARMKESNVPSAQVTQITAKMSDAAVAGLSMTSRGSIVLGDASGAIASGAIASLANHGLSREVIRVATGDITKSVVKAAVTQTTDTAKIANIQDQTITRVSSRLQEAGFSEAETDLIRDDLSSRATEAAAEAKSAPISSVVVVRKNPQLKWLAAKDGTGVWGRVDLTSTTACDDLTCKIPVTANDKSYALAYVCETSINTNAPAPDANDPYFFQRNDFDPMMPIKRVNLGVVYDKVVGTIGGQSPNCNDLYMPSRDPGASAPIYAGAGTLRLVSVKVTVTDPDTENTVCQIGMTPFTCGTETTLALPLGKGVRVLVGSGLGSSNYVAPSGVGYLETPKKVKLFTIDVESGRSYSLPLATGSLQPSEVTLSLDGLTKDRAVTLSTMASIATSGTSFSVNLALSSHRFVPADTSTSKVTYNLPTAANAIGATVSLTGTSSLQERVTSGQSSAAAWRSQAFTKKILPSDTTSSVTAKMLPDVSGTKVSLTNGTGTLLPLTWTSDLTASDSVLRRLNLHQLTPEAAVLYTIFAPSTGVAGNTSLLIPNELRTLSGWHSSWDLEKPLASFWSTAMSSPIGTDGTSYSLSSAQLPAVDTADKTRTGIVCKGTEPSGTGISRGASSVDQKLTPNGWTPTSYWHYTSETSPGACEFTCQTGQKWDGKVCVQSIGTFNVRVAQSLPSYFENSNSQLFQHGGNVCVLNSTWREAITLGCYDSTKNEWTPVSSIREPRLNFPNLTMSGIPVHLQNVSGILTSIYTESDGVRFAKFDSTNSVWVRSSLVLPGTVPGSTLQYAQLYSSVNLFAVYAWSKSDIGPWFLHVAKSADNGTTWTQLAVREIQANSVYTAWNVANKTMYARYISVGTSPATKLLQVSAGITPVQLSEAPANVGPVAVWNGELYAIENAGHLASYLFNSTNAAWGRTQKLANAVDLASVSMAYLDVYEENNTTSYLDIFHFDQATKHWKHSRLASGSTTASPSNEVVAFAQGYINLPHKRPFVNTIATTRYFNFYDGAWKRVAYSGNNVQSTEKTLSSINAKITPDPNTSFVSAAGLYIDGSKLYRVASVMGESSPDLQSSEILVGNTTWSSMTPWNVAGFTAVSTFGDFASLGDSGIVSLDCAASGNYRLSATRMSASRSGISVDAGVSCVGKSPDQSWVVTNPAATNGNPNIFTITVGGTLAAPKLMARRFIYNTSTPSIGPPSSKPSLDLFAMTRPAGIRQVVFAKDRVHVLMCEESGLGHILTWLNPNLGLLDSASITMLSPAVVEGCPASSLTADLSTGNILLKMLDEPRASFLYDKGAWQAATVLATSVALDAYKKLVGGNVFVHGSNYCKITGMGAAGNLALVSMCVAKPTTAVPNPTVQRRILDDVDFGGFLHDYSVALFDGKIHVVYPSLYLPRTFRYVMVPE